MKDSEKMCECGHPQSHHNDPNPRYQIEFSAGIREALGLPTEPKPEPKESDMTGWLCGVIVDGWTCSCEGFREKK